MVRVKGAIHAKAKHNGVLKFAKGYRSARSKQYRIAKQTIMRTPSTAYEDGKQRKRQFHQLQIARINTVYRMNKISCSKFMLGLKKVDVTLNRKVLFELVINDTEGFTELVETAKKALA